jgi:hypothetical protein
LIRLVFLTLLGVAAIVLAAMAGPAYDAYEESGFVVVMMASGLVAYLAYRTANGAPEGAALLIIFIVAFLIRLIAISDEPLLSSDVFRYVWDGRVAGAGINPYRYIPADPALAFLRDTAIYPEINRADYAHTAYPPFAQMFFYLATRFGDKLDVMRLGFCLCEVVAAGAIISILKRLGRSRGLVVGYLWHPLAVWEIANGGHVDGLLAMLVTIAVLLLVARRRILGALIIACGVLVKPYAIAMLPAFWRPWDFRAPILCILLAALLYLPYLSVGFGVIGFVPTYLHEEGFIAGNGFWLVAAVRGLIGNQPGIEETYFAIGLAVFAYAVIRILRKPMYYAAEDQVRDAMVLLFIGLFVLSPNYPWYYLPLVPFVALGGGEVIWVTTMGAILLHTWWPTPDDQPTRFMIWKTVLNGGWMLTLLATYSVGRVRGSRSISPDRVAPVDLAAHSPS